MKERLTQLFGEEWYSVLSEYLHSKEFSDLGSKINTLKTKTIIYPDKEKIFRIFKEVPYDKISLIMLGQDPYFDGSATGLAFDCSESIKLSPSLKIIHKEIELEYPELTDRFEMPFGGMDKWDLTYLVKQGVFLYNTALTVEKGKPGSHIDLWKPFTLKVIEALNKIEWLPWLLLGKKAQEFISLINKNHSIITAPYPASEVYSGNTSGFLGSGAFRQVNYELDKHNKIEIQW